MRITMVEISETTETDDIGVWGEDAWGGGKVYG
jgi:hypothetical protein